MTLSEYKKIKSNLEKANLALVNLIDSLSIEESGTVSLFGDIEIDIYSMAEVLQMRQVIQGIDRKFDDEFARIQTNALIEKKALLGKQ